MQRRPQTYCKLQAAFSLEQSQSVMIVVRFHPFVRQLNLATSGNPALCCRFARPRLALRAPRAWRLFRPLTKPVARIDLVPFAVNEFVQNGLVWHSLHAFRRNGVRKTLRLLALPWFHGFIAIFDHRLAYAWVTMSPRSAATARARSQATVFRHPFV